MNFPRSFLSFLASVAAFITRLCCPNIYQQQRTQQPQEPQSLPRPASACIDIERQSVSPRTPSPPQPQMSSQLERLLAEQNHQQWQNAVLAFCFSYALGVSLQFASTTDNSNHDVRLPFPFVFLSFLVLLSFIFILVAFFIHQASNVVSQALQKAALFMAAAAFCQALSIPLWLELKCVMWALFFLSLLISIIFKCLTKTKKD